MTEHHNDTSRGQEGRMTLTGNTELTIDEVQARVAEHDAATPVYEQVAEAYGPGGEAEFEVDFDAAQNRWLKALKGVWDVRIARLCLSLAAQLQQARPIMPGELCRHNKSGGVYQVTMRRLAYASLFEGEVLGLGGGPGDGAIVTDDIQTAEQIVIYRRESGDYAHFVRPARLFDSPGRFTRIAQPAEAGDQA